MPPLDQFKRDGYVIIEDVLNAAEVSALRRGLDPVFSALIDQGPAGPHWDPGHASSPARSSSRQGTCRVSISNALEQVGDKHGLGDQLLRFLLHPATLDFTQQVLGPWFQLDDFSASAFPPACGDHEIPQADRGTAGQEDGSSLVLWHRDSFNTITQFNYFYTGQTGAGGGALAAGRGLGDDPEPLPQPKSYAPPLMLNQLLYLQDDSFSVLPGS
jgi:hypothetical protein|eukprot:COSAG06_NODE_2134_length_7517_cov_52.273928_10_plen_215_part_00